MVPVASSHNCASRSPEPGTDERRTPRQVNPAESSRYGSSDASAVSGTGSTSSRDSDGRTSSGTGWFTACQHRMNLTDNAVSAQDAMSTQKPTTAGQDSSRSSSRAFSRSAGYGLSNSTQRPSSG